jgi:hypothetical protein
MHDGGTLPACFGIWFPVLFVALWIIVCLFIGFVSGWSSLTQRFKSDTALYGEIKTAGPLFYSVYMRFWSHYSGVVRLAAAEDALYLSILILFRAGHPPLRVPWNEIKFDRTQFLLRRLVVLTLGNEERIPLRISERMARDLGITGRFPVESASQWR